MSLCSNSKCFFSSFDKLNTSRVGLVIEWVGSAETSVMMLQHHDFALNDEKDTSRFVLRTMEGTLTATRVKLGSVKRGVHCDKTVRSEEYGW